MTIIWVTFHIAALIGLAVYGLLGYLTLWLLIRHRRDPLPPPPAEWSALPPVAVQLPIYNEREVVQRLIASVAALDYPRERLEIQVLDDSTDETTALAAESIAILQARGINITLHHRENRHGFKAGALQETLPCTSGQFIAIFDADFAPQPDFLLRTIPYLANDPGLGAVQTRWGHLNAGDSSLTRAQAIALDKHFAVEQLVRHRANLFPKFNGSAGVWRRECIEQSGGWQVDTVCEDLCLSMRAVLSGWGIHYANNLIAPAELPSSVLAYKVQQSRWATGATQCLLKYARPICHAEGQSLLARLYALLTMAAYATHVFFLILLLIQLPLLLSGYRLPAGLALFSLIGLGQPILFIIAQQRLYPDWPARVRYLPVLLLIAIGIAPNNVLAFWRGLSHRHFTFARTPKGPAHSYRLAAGRILLFEWLLTLYSAVALAVAVIQRNPGPIVLLATCLLGLGYVAIASLLETRRK